VVDEFQISLVPYLAGKGSRVFDDLEQPTKLELVSVAPIGGGISELVYRPIRA
jgi:dihydrofolate reductase